VTMTDAAQALGISKEAVRKRVSRGTLPSDVGEDGRRYVYLDVGEDTGASTTSGDPRDELIVTLKEQLEAERNAHAETRRIAYTLAQRVPELEAARSPRDPAEATGAPETAAEDPDKGDTPGPQHPVERPSWWRRFFGFE
jgi:hypothetical protein